MTSVLDETFLPYETERTVLRALRPDDAPVLAAYRSDPQVARSQDWELPFSEQAASDLIAAQTDLSGPAAGRWIQIGIEHEGVLAGRLARERRGTNGFGYDPIFIPSGETRTTAEMTADEKDAISHRGRAFRALADLLLSDQRP